MKRIINTVPFGAMAILLLSVFYSMSGYSQIVDSSRLTGMELKVFNSKILNEKRKILIQTPSKMNRYDQYPVLYLLDGEAHSQMVAGQVQYLSEAYKIIPNLIIVAIENTDRVRDLTPTHSIIGPDGKPDTSSNAFGKRSGGGENFLRFIKQELMPYIDSSYPTTPYKILSGHSLGGLMAVHCLLNHPDYFNGYIAISPSLQWDNRALLRNAPSKLDSLKTSHRTLFFSDAHEDSAFHSNQLQFDSVLKRRAAAGMKYRYIDYPEETHISEPVKAFYDGIRTIYPNWHLPYNSSQFRKTMNSRIIKDHFLQLSKTYGYNVIPLHDELVQISRFLRNDPNRIKDAIDLLETYATNYSSSALLFETLADTYSKAGNANDALKYFQKALQLDSSNENIKQKIKTINK
jgi:predicted alpha/beta superfamily hydrolase